MGPSITSFCCPPSSWGASLLVGAALGAGAGAGGAAWIADLLAGAAAWAGVGAGVRACPRQALLRARLKSLLRAVSLGQKRNIAT